MAWESVHSKDTKPQSRNLNLSLGFRKITWGKASRRDVILSFGKTMSQIKDGRSSTCSYSLPSVLGIWKMWKLGEWPIFLPCHTQTQSLWFQLFCFLVFTGQFDSSYYPWPWILLECFPIVLPLRLRFDRSLQSFLTEADTVEQAETNWSREKQISVPQSGSPTLLYLWRVSKQCSLARSPTIPKIPADGWEIIATICC